MTKRSEKILCVTSSSDRPEAETFIGLQAKGFVVRVLCSPRAPHYQRLQDAGVSVAPLEIIRRIDSKAIDRIRSELESATYNILHLFDNRTVLNGLMAARGKNVKIVTYRGIVGNESFLNPGSWLRYLNPRVDRIVCVAEAVREYFLNLRLFWIRIPPDKVVTIYKGHDLAWYKDSPVDLAKFGIPGGAFVVGCVANWRPRKGVEILIEACKHLPADALLHIILVGNMKNKGLQEQIAASPFRDHIHMLGFRDDAPAIIAACDISILASLKREGLPKTVIEAMAYGVPSIVTNVGGSPELVNNEESGLVIPPGDPQALAQAILRLYADGTLRATLGEHARRRLQSHFPIQTTIDQTAQLYRDVLAD